MRATALRTLLGRSRPAASTQEPSAPPGGEVADDGDGPPPDGAAATDVACRAPFTSLHVDQFGDVRPCCQSSRVLGNVAEATFEEIWTGPRVAELRDAMRRDDLSLGCEHCEWAGRHGRESTYATRFDHDRLPEEGAGPVRLELAPSNACNLQCAMCNGDWSSSIRLHREGRPALERRFGERQIDEVAAMADGLDEIHLFGGEPLLMPEALRLLEIAADHDVRCVITTNGSVLTPRVERLLDRPGVDLVVSVDGASAEVYDAIRCGASWDVLQGHLDRFAEIASRHGNEIDIAHCLMTANWFEFPDHLRWAAERGLEVYVNDVLSPEDLSLHHLSPPELRTVVDELTRRRAAEIDDLGPAWVDTWERAIASLEQTLADGTGGDRHPHLGTLDASTAPEPRPDAPSAALAARIRQRQRQQDHRVDLDLDATLHVRTVTTALEGEPLPFALDLDDVIGASSMSLATLVPAGATIDARTVRRWDADAAIVERRYHLPGPGTDVIERRTIERTDDGVALRFEHRRPLTDAEKLACAEASAADGAVVAIEMDADGVVTAIGPTELAADLGLATELGITSRAPTDALVAERADPPPVAEMVEIDPGLVVVDLGWPDQDLVALASVSAAGTRVWVLRPTPA